MTTTTPERSINQRTEALRRANAIRFYRARLKRDLKAGRKSVASVLANPPAEIATMHVVDLLLAVPKVGRVKAAQILAGDLARGPISPRKPVAGLSDRQRALLVRELSGR